MDLLDAESTARSGDRNGSKAITFIFRPTPRSATIEPMLPQPMTPSVLPKISTPMNLFFSHLPARIEVSACGNLPRQRQHQRDRVLGGGDGVADGVFITITPLAVAAGTSTLSTPMPARPITFRFLALSRIFGDTLVAERMARPSKWPIDVGELVLVLAEVRLEIDIDAAILEDLHGGRRQGIGNQNVGHGAPHAAFGSAVLAWE